MDRFRELQVFVHVAETGGFASAARALGMSPPAVTRTVGALEERLGTRLFRRTTRSVSLTESGIRFLADGRRLLDELAEAEQAAVGAHAEPRGELRVTAPSLFGRHFVAPALGAFLDRHPQVRARTLFVDRVVNLIDEGQDVAVRIGHLPDSTLSAIRVGTVRRVVFGAPAYFAIHGIPERPEELASHRTIFADPLAPGDDWPFSENGSVRHVRLKPRVRMNTNDAVVRLALDGWGVAQALSYQIAPFLAEGRLEIVLPEFELPPLPVHVMHQEGRLVSSKVRAFVDWLVATLRADPALNWS